MIISESPTVYNTGHKVGQFFRSHCRKFAYVPIPKCASSWASTFTRTQLDWYVSLPHDILHELSCKKLVILREPLDRWVSGMSQYLTMNHRGLPLENRDLIRFFYERIDFDPHTTPQVNYLLDVDTDDIIFFRFDKNLEKNFKEFIKNNTGQEYEGYVFKNETPITGYAPLCKKMIKHITFSSKEWSDKIEAYYKKDFELYNTVKFYGE